jgi:hypothetical protein
LGRDGGHEKIPKVSSLCHRGGSQLEDVPMDIFFSLPFPAGTANAPKNVKKEDFYRALFLLLIFFFSGTVALILSASSEIGFD